MEGSPVYFILILKRFFYNLMVSALNSLSVDIFSIFFISSDSFGLLLLNLYFASFEKKIFIQNVLPRKNLHLGGVFC